MAVLKVWGFIVLALFYWNCATGCTWMKTQNKAALSSFQVLSNSSISHLEQACNDSTQSPGNLSLEFPHKQYNRILQLEVKDHVLFVLRTLKNIMRTYSGKYEKSDCDQHKLQIFLLDVDRQILELERCAKNIIATEEQKKISKKMDLHFKSLISHLKDTDYSTEGWNDVAGIVLKHLRRLDLLATKTKIDLHEYHASKHQN